MVSSLSAEEVEGFLAGKGLGLAKPAELNGYPGPIHALELAAELKLSAEQKQAIQAAYDKMNGKARELGAGLVQRGSDERAALGARGPAGRDVRRRHCAARER